MSTSGNENISARFTDLSTEKKLFALYDKDTQAHRDIVRKSRSKGDGHLPQPVRVETTPSQQALRDLLENTERRLVPLDEPEPEDMPPWMKDRGKTIFIE
jgi:hypothetical protein